MNTEQRFLVAVLADYLSSRVSDHPNDLNWEELFLLSEQHQVSGIVYAQCRNSLFQQAYYATIANYMKRKEAIALLAKNLREECLHAYPVEKA